VAVVRAAAAADTAEVAAAAAVVVFARAAAAVNVVAVEVEDIHATEGNQPRAVIRERGSL